MSFEQFKLSPPILHAVAAEGYDTPSPIQAGVIPPALKGRDILGTAQTGTGKTAAFALPIIHRLTDRSSKPSSGKGPPRGRGRAARALVLCPTRELAAQILESFETYGRRLPLKSTAIYGGVGQGKQVSAIRSGVDVVVACPGRLLDLIGQGHLDLTRIKTVVLDEADRMLDMGFIHPIRRIMAEIPSDRQTMLLSATISKEIRTLADDLLHKPVVVETAPESSTAELVDQRLYLVEKARKSELLVRLFERGDMARTLVFTRTKYGADKLTRFLKKAKIKAEAIHGDKSQGQRTRAMEAFRSGKAEALVATDVAARGIDVDGVTHVVNYEMPIEPESYVHRIGRTARAGASGHAISFCDRPEIELLRAIERRTDARPTLETDHDDLTYTMPSDGGRKAAKDAKAARSSAAEARSRQPRRSRRNPPRRNAGSGEPKSRGKDSGGSGFSKSKRTTKPTGTTSESSPANDATRRSEKPKRAGGKGGTSHGPRKKTAMRAPGSSNSDRRKTSHKKNRAKKTGTAASPAKNRHAKKHKKSAKSSPNGFGKGRRSQSAAKRSRRGSGGSGP